MPQASFRSFIGIAKDSTSLTLTANAAASATTVTLSAAPGASTTLFIWDGVNSESVAVSANGTTTTPTVAALAHAHNAGVHVSVQTTGSTGPTDYIPITQLELVPTIAQLHDTALRGSNVEVYGSQQGLRFDELTLGGPAFGDTLGYVLGAIFGSVDFSGGTPNTHTFGTNNQGNAQPTPFILYDYEPGNSNTRAVPGAKADEVTLKFDPSGFITWTAKFTGFEDGIVTNPTQSYSSVVPMAAWQTVTTIGGTVTATLVSADIAYKRQQLERIGTLQGIQDLYAVFAGALKATGKLVFVMEDDSQIANFLNNSQPSLDITATNGTGASQTSIGLHWTKANYETGTPKQTGGKGYVELEVSFEGLANTTDATTSGGGYSPGRAVLKNAKASGTYQ